MNTNHLAPRFTHFADHECPDEPLYQAICRIVARSPGLLSLLRNTPSEQQRPNLWLAAVHDALLANVAVAAPLAAYYPSLGGQRVPDADLAAHLVNFVRAHEPTLRECMRSRTTQTNEIGRSAVLWPALHAIAQRCGNPQLALLDVGCSAGLNLGVDDYNHGAQGDHPTQPPAPSLRCELRGPHRPRYTPALRIVQRCGIDPAPVNVDDTTAVRWLRACLWPSDRARAHRFDQAVALARTRRWPVQRVPDCTAFMGEWLASLPSDVQPVIFNSWVLTYFESAALARHIETLHTLVRQTGAMWLSAESPSVRIEPDIPAPTAQACHSTDTLWTLCSRSTTGTLHFELLARSHAHGRWMEWLNQQVA